MADHPAKVWNQVLVRGETWTLTITLNGDLLDFQMEETDDPHTGGGYVVVKVDEFIKALERLLGR